jgi:hypothetical protein
VTLHTDIINAEDKTRLRKHNKNKKESSACSTKFKRLIDMLNYCACEVRAQLVKGNMFSCDHENDNMTGGGETRSTYTTDS